MPHPILFTLNIQFHSEICHITEVKYVGEAISCLLLIIGVSLALSVHPLSPFLFLSSLPLTSVSDIYHSPSSSFFCRFQCLQLPQHFKLVLLFRSCVNFHFLHFKCSSHLSIESKTTPPPPLWLLSDKASPSLTSSPQAVRLKHGKTVSVF